MKTLKFTLVGLSMLMLTMACGGSTTDKKEAVVTIEAKSDSGISGTVTFSELDGIVTMTANISGLSEGNHAIHIHEFGDCSAKDGTSAGEHWNPTNVEHGKWASDHYHIADIGNLTADANGEAVLTRTTDLWCIDCSDKNKNILGKAIVIHEDEDDFSSQPSGAAGARIGCGEILIKK